jgi:hypothetical protein
VRHLQAILKAPPKGPNGEILVDDMAAKKLLEASLISLEVLGRDPSPPNEGPGAARDTSLYGRVISALARGRDPPLLPAIDTTEEPDQESAQDLPLSIGAADPFLQGAVWLTRNVSVAVDVFAGEFEGLRRQCLQELGTLLQEHPRDEALQQALLSVSDSLGSVASRLEACRAAIRGTIDVSSQPLLSS